MSALCPSECVPVHLSRWTRGGGVAAAENVGWAMLVSRGSVGVDVAVGSGGAGWGGVGLCRPPYVPPEKFFTHQAPQKEGGEKKTLCLTHAWAPILQKNRVFFTPNLHTRSIYIVRSPQPRYSCAIPCTCTLGACCSIDCCADPEFCKCFSGSVSTKLRNLEALPPPPLHEGERWGGWGGEHGSYTNTNSRP